MIKMDIVIDVRRASKIAPHRLMSYIVEVHHTRGLILLVQKYEENREMQKKKSHLIFRIPITDDR